MPLKHTNFASTTLAANVLSTDLSLTVPTGQGSLFPTLGTKDYFYAVITDNLTLPTVREVIKVTARSVDTFTIQRGKDGTTARAWLFGQYLALREVNASIHDPTVIPPSIDVKAYGAVGDGVTDDTAAIQAAFDVGGNISFTPGVSYRTTAQLNITAVRTIIHGNNSIITFDSSSGTSDCIRIGNDVAQVYGVVIYDLIITRPGAQVATTGAGIHCAFTGGTKFYNVSVVGASKIGNGFYISRGIDTWFFGCYVDHTVSHGIFSIGTNATTGSCNCQIFDTQIQYCGGNGIYAFDFTMGSAYFRNIIFSVTGLAIVLDATNVASAGGSFEISQNVFDTCTAGGIYLDKVGSIRIVDNWFSANGSTNLTIKANGPPGQIVVSSNLFYGSTFDSIVTEGANVNFTANLIYGGANGIFVRAAALHTVITSNTITNCSAWGINLLEAPTNTVVIGNLVRNNATGNISLGGAGTLTIAGNSAQIAATGVVVGASPFTFTNTRGAALNLYFNGGNISLITLNGRTVFNTTDRMITVPPAGVAIVTYTVLPTLTYEGLV